MRLSPEKSNLNQSVTQQNVNQRGHVGNVDYRISVHISADLANRAGTQQVVDQRGHISDINRMVVVHVAW